MKLGLLIPDWNEVSHGSTVSAALAAAARMAEMAGFSSLWTLDHFFQMEVAGAAEEPMPEAYTALAFAASQTSRIKLGALVTGVIYRYPGVLVKTVTTLDVLSGGRAYLGIGASWYEREAHGLGVPFPPLAERFERLEETLQIAHQMWRGEVKPYQGRHYQLAETLGVPMPLSKPHPPILIGGGGEKKTLRLVAQYADACNFDTGIGYDGIRHKLSVLREHCAAVGRDYDSIERTAVTDVRLGDGGFSPQGLLDHFGALAAVGVQQTICRLHGVTDPAVFELFSTQIFPHLPQ